VKRQYLGCAGRVANGINVVYASYAAAARHAVIAARLHLPADWAGDRQRRRAAGVPDDLEFKTKPQLAIEMLDEITAEGSCPPWVTGDEVYGRDARLRGRLGRRRMPKRSAHLSGAGQDISDHQNPPVTPPRCMRPTPCATNTRTDNLFNSTASTCRKSTRIPAAWVLRNGRQVGPRRRGAGSNPAAWRISPIVDGAIVMPSFASSQFGGPCPVTTEQHNDQAGYPAGHHVDGLDQHPASPPPAGPVGRRRCRSTAESSIRAAHPRGELGNRRVTQFPWPGWLSETTTMPAEHR
jgi:hypothetical protein